MNAHSIEDLENAKKRAHVVANSSAYKDFVDLVRRVYPWRFEKLPPTVLERDYLRIVDHHLKHLVPRVARYVDAGTQQVLDFGCGSGGSAIALALVYPNVTFVGADIDPEEVRMARQRSRIYSVSDRCEFHCISAGLPLTFEAGSFDFCLCSSVLEYAVETDVRRFCVQEMVRLLRPKGLLFCSVPNRLYPYEIHTHKWGWNYFPKVLHARTVDCTAWEVKRLALPRKLSLHQTPWVELVRPWSNFCLRSE
jgi:SAM-dependent methyltransferase